MNNPTQPLDSDCLTGRTAAAPSAEPAQQHQSQQPTPDWLQTVWERFYVKYATGRIKGQQAEALSRLQEKIEKQLKAELTQEQYQMILEWEDIKNQRQAIEIDHTYEVGVKVGIKIEQEYPQHTQLPER